MNQEEKRVYNKRYVKDIREGKRMSRFTITEEERVCDMCGKTFRTRKRYQITCNECTNKDGGYPFAEKYCREHPLMIRKRTVTDDMLLETVSCDRNQV